MHPVMKKSFAILSLSAMITAGTAYAAPNDTVQISPVQTQIENPAITVTISMKEEAQKLKQQA